MRFAPLSATQFGSLHVGRAFARASIVPHSLVHNKFSSALSASALSEVVVRSDSSASNPDTLDGKHKGTFVVVGAGPAGAVAAMAAAKRGYRVQVFERLPDPCSPQQQQQQQQQQQGQQQQGRRSDSARAYVMQVCPRALNVIQDQTGGAEPEFMRRAAYKGSRSDNKYYVVDAVGDTTYIVDRRSLSRDLVAEAKRLYPNDITFQFNMSLASLDLAKRSATFASSTPSSSSTAQANSSETMNATSTSSGTMTAASTTVQYDLIVGADGANSAVRTAMEAQVPELKSELLFETPRTYKTFGGLPRSMGSGKEASASQTQEQRTVTASSSSSGTGSSSSSSSSGCGTGSEWELVKGIKDHKPAEYMYWVSPVIPTGPRMTAWLAEDGSVGGFLSYSTYEPEALRKALQEAHPTLPHAWLDALVASINEDGTAAPHGRFGRTIRVSQFHGPRAVLVGDAAHAVTATTGQGVNMAVESVGAFTRALDTAHGDLDATPALFTALRRRDAHALQHLDITTLASFTPGGIFPWYMALYGKVLLAASMACAALLHKLAPSVFPKAGPPVTLLCFTTNSYSSILLNMHLRAATAVSLALSALGAVLLAAALAVWRFGPWAAKAAAAAVMA